VVAKEYQRDNGWRRLEGLTLVTFCQVEYSTPSGQGAEVGEQLERAPATSLFVRGGAFANGMSLDGAVNGSMGGKK